MTVGGPTRRSTVQQWLDDDRGGSVLRALLASAGADPASLDPVRQIPIAQLVELSGGTVPAAMLDELMRKTYGDDVPAEEPEALGGSRFAGRTLVVTGAGSGIGRATAKRILAEGGHVIAVDVDENRIRELEASERVTAISGDITSADIAGRIVSATDAIDGLANVAGIMDAMVPLHEVDDALWARVFAVNVEGSFRLMRAVLPSMIQRGKGAIVNVASEASLRGNAAGTAYTASKHAVVGLTRSAAFFYGRAGVRVNAVAPGPVATGIEGGFGSEFGKERLSPFFPLMPPVTTADQIAASITWLLSDEAANINGVVLASDGGWSVQ